MYTYKMYILADIIINCRNQDLYQTNTTFEEEKNLNKKFLFYNVKYFKFYKYILKMYIMQADIKINCRNQDLYKTITTFEKKI